MMDYFSDYEIDPTACLAVLCTWRRREILVECIESMLINPGYPLRIWVIDNGNCDGTREYLLAKLYQGSIEKVIMEKRNWFIHPAINQFKALIGLTSSNPYIPLPRYVFITNDDMIVKADNWLRILVESYEELKESPYKIGILSPFHCKTLSGGYASSMTPEEYWDEYPISTYISGNTLFMDTEIFLDLPYLPTNHPTEGGDWAWLEYLKAHGYKCARTKEELVSQHKDTQGSGKYNYTGHW